MTESVESPQAAEQVSISLPLNDAFVSAWKKIMHSHWWGGGLWWVAGYKKEMFPLTWEEKEALAKLLIQIQPQVNAFRESNRTVTHEPTR